MRCSSSSTSPWRLPSAPFTMRVSPGRSLPTGRAARRESVHAEARANGDVRLGWTREEDHIILSSVTACGPKWVEIAMQLPGRTEHAARNRYHRLISRSAGAESDSMIRTSMYATHADPGLDANA